jgi:uncharacterized protein YkwD
LFLVIALLAAACFQPAAMASAAPPAPDLFRLTPEAFRMHTAAQRPLDRAKLDSRLLATAIFHATNNQRARHKLPPFVHSEALQRAAQGHSRDMATGGFFSHKNPKDPARRTLQQRLAMEGVTEGLRSENIAKTPVQGMTYLTAAEAIVTQWMNSRSHRGAILDRNLRYLGCGVHVDATSPHFYILSTQNLASTVPEAPTP